MKSGRMERGWEEASSLSQPLCQVVASFPVLQQFSSVDTIVSIDRETEWD